MPPAIGSYTAKIFKRNLLHARIQAFLLVVLSLVTIFTQSQNLKFQVRVNYSENIFLDLPRVDLSVPGSVFLTERDRFANFPRKPFVCLLPIFALKHGLFKYSPSPTTSLFPERDRRAFLY